MKAFWLALSFLLLGSCALAQSSLVIDKLEKKDITEAPKEVGMSSLVEGAVDSPDLVVYAMVYQPHLKAWRLFRAVIEQIPEAGKYRWRAICQLGELDGTGAGKSYQVKALAFDPNQIRTSGLPEKLSTSLLSSNTVVLKRIK